MRFIEEEETPESSPSNRVLAIADAPATEEAPDDLQQQKDTEKEDDQTHGTESHDQKKSAEKEDQTHDAKSDGQKKDGTNKEEPKKDTTDLKRFQHRDGEKSKAMAAGGPEAASASSREAKQIRAELIRPGGRQTSDHH